MNLIRYLANLSKGRLILWCYFIWYLVVLVRYFDPSPRLWLTSLGLSLIIGFSVYPPEPTTRIFGQVLVRRNVIRTVDGSVDPTGFSAGIWLNSCDNLIVESNVVDVNSSKQHNKYSLIHVRNGAYKYLNNMNSSGKLIQGYNADAGTEVNELATDAELTMLNSG